MSFSSSFFLPFGERGLTRKRPKFHVKTLVNHIYRRPQCTPSRNTASPERAASTTEWGVQYPHWKLQVAAGCLVTPSKDTCAANNLQSSPLQDPAHIANTSATFRARNLSGKTTGSAFMPPIITPAAARTPSSSAVSPSRHGRKQGRLPKTSAAGYLSLPLDFPSAACARPGGSPLILHSFCFPR